MYTVLQVECICYNNVYKLQDKAATLICTFHQVFNSVADPEGGRGDTAPSNIGQNLAKSAPFLPILASTPPLTDHPGSAPATINNMRIL